MKNSLFVHPHGSIKCLPCFSPFLGTEDIAENKKVKNLQFLRGEGRKIIILIQKNSYDKCVVKTIKQRNQIQSDNSWGGVIYDGQGR